MNSKPTKKLLLQGVLRIPPRLRWGRLGLPLLLAVLHILLMVHVTSVWSRAAREYNGELFVGPESNAATERLNQIDFPASLLCEHLSMRLLLSGHIRISDSVGVNFAFVYWPLLLVLGTAQWFLVGLAITHVYRNWAKHSHNGLPVTFVAVHIGLCAWTAWVWIAAFNEYGGASGYEFNISYDRLKLLDFPVSIIIDLVAFSLASLPETFAAAGAVLMITSMLLFVTLGTAQWYFAAIGLRLLTVRYGLVGLISSAVLWVVLLDLLTRYWL